MVSTSDFRNGMVIRLDGQLFFMTEFEHFKPGKGAAVVRTKLKSVMSGAVIDRTFRSGDKVDDVRLEKRKSQYLYKQDAFYIFMDTRTYEQYEVPTEIVGDAQTLLQESEIVDVLIAEGNALGVELPIFVELKVDQTDPRFARRYSHWRDKARARGNRGDSTGSAICRDWRCVED